MKLSHQGPDTLECRLAVFLRALQPLFPAPQPDGNQSSSFFFFFFLGPHPWHLEVPRLEVNSELQLPAYIRSEPHLQPTPQLTAMLDT